MASRIIVLGSVNTDLVIRGPQLPGPGETVLGGEFYRAAGGKGANQAVAAARLGDDPVTDLAAALDKLAEDPTLRRTLGVANRLRVSERFTFNGMVEAYRKLYREGTRGRR